MKNECVICEAGFLWRRVLRRLESRLNAKLEDGWTIKEMHSWGLLRKLYVIVLAKPE